VRGFELSESSRSLLVEATRVLKRGGLLFIYGLPYVLPYWGRELMLAAGGETRMEFKYWIALDIDKRKRADFLVPSHMGMLLFAKVPLKNREKFPSFLNTKVVRVPHRFCAACKQNVKDYGGKKHLMNPVGAALSDVWRDLPKSSIQRSKTPRQILDRVFALSVRNGSKHLHIVQSDKALRDDKSPRGKASLPGENGIAIETLESDKVYSGDCCKLLKRVCEVHPEGVFDMAFADPPYNLRKGYNDYEDSLADKSYLHWCNEWLAGMAKALKPGGSLFVLNLPKWAVHHAAFLNGELEFRHWIVWDALSDPRGKIMPAHYALLYYTKRGGKPVFNYSSAGEKAIGENVRPPDSAKYCLRAGCVRDRKARGDDEKIELSDIWFDIHRLKHKRDRDAHPCQLPEKLMERIIRLTTNRGGLVFDPFCGAGTTAIAARKLGRHFVVVDSDPKYVRITNEKLAAMEHNAETNGNLIVPRISIKRTRGSHSKKAIELYLQNLAKKLGRMPTEDEVKGDQPEILRQIDLTYPTRGAAFKRAKVALGGHD